MIKEGLIFEVERVVDQSSLAKSVGSGDLEVLATPSLVATIENAALMSVAKVLTSEETTVGGLIEIKHLRPTPLGDHYKATATLEKVEGKKLEFSVRAEDSRGLIAEGKHIRFIVNREKFTDRL